MHINYSHNKKGSNFVLERLIIHSLSTHILVVSMRLRLRSEYRDSKKNNLKFYRT
jgi:hypothetical protein